MKTSTLCFTLSAMCLVACISADAEISWTNGTGSVPDGYVAHPDVGFAYKLHGLLVSWTEAKNRCIEEGAQLALIDTPKKVKYVIRQMGFWVHAHVGIIRSTHDNGSWVAASTGLQVSSLPWIASQPDQNGNCACVNSRHDGLDTISCATGTNFVCELPIDIEKIEAAN